MPRFHVPADPRQTGPFYLPPQTTRWYARQQGHLLEVRKVVNHSVVPTEAKRGKIMGFTRAARLRMLRLIARIDWARVGGSSFITLTYPDHVVNRTYQQRTTDRTLFIKGIEEIIGTKVATLWRVEWVARKSGQFQGQMKPHLHIVVFSASQIGQGDVRSLWRRITKVKGPLATDTRKATDGSHAAKYAAKYAAKECSLGALDNNAYLETHGRAWGTTRKSMIPFGPARIIRELTNDGIKAAMKIAGRILEREYVGTFFILGDAAPILLHEISDIGKCPIDDTDG